MEAGLYELRWVERLKEFQEELDSHLACLSCLLVLLYQSHTNINTLEEVTYQSLSDHAVKEDALVVRWEQCDEVDQVR